MKARLLHLHSSFDLGGKEARATALMNHFGKRAEHVIVSAVPEAFSARGAIAKGVKAGFPVTAPSLTGGFSLGRLRQLAAFMKGFDLVLTYNWGAMDAVMAHTLFGESMGAPPLIHHEDGFNHDEAKRLKRSRNWYRMVALGRTHTLVVPSKTLEAIALKTWRQPERRVRRIPNGINLAPFRAAPRKGAIPGFERKEGEVVVGTVAGLRAVKNLPLLVRAVADAKADIRLIIVGAGPERKAIEAEAAKAGIADKVVMPGFLPEPARYMGHFDIFALSSDSEQFPLSVVEAMASGLPVVSTRVGDVEEMLSVPNRDYLSSPGHVTPLAFNLERLAQDIDLRRTIGDANRADAEANYDAEKMFERYAKLYARAMKQPAFAA